ncbi:hypothetical protein V5O48_007712 [Marasmius crinis-equi]|uniref:glutathione transferase n=1 Tax=Marasmius crinis-equi TaxID=585013 RepID=A0ABR3FFW7_9AGAR
MVLKLYGSTTSTCTLTVATVLYEKQIPYEFHNIDRSIGGHRTPEYLEKQPFGEVPYIVDDGFLLYESRAICRYLALKYADKDPKLIPDPTDLKATARFEQGASIEQSNFDAIASRAVYENAFKPLFGLVPDPKVFHDLIAKLGANLQGYEMILGKQKYIAGDEISLADLFHLSYGAWLKVDGSEFMSEQGPNVARWWNEITSRASWQAVKAGVPPKPLF